MGPYASKPIGTKYVAVCTRSEYAEADEEDVLEPFQAFGDPNAPSLAHYDLEQGTNVRVTVA